MRSIFILLFFLPCAHLAAQISEDSFYQFPINPGNQNYLAGTMGEMRGTHFHAGLDIKTGGKIGLPVYAAADGYVERVRISTGGYGHAIYLRHQNGHTTLYAHLDSFESQLGDFVLGKQYEEESFQIQVFPEKELFSYRQGEIIGYSGNTGSSSGPHLHFEIRDENQKILDPLTYGFTEIKDQIAPILKSVAFVTLDGDSRINGSFGRVEFDVIKINGKYTITKPLSLKGRIGIQIYHYDHNNGSYSRNGIPELTLLIDKDTVFSQFKSNMSFNLMSNVLVHMDYGRYRNGGRRFNKLYLDEGNQLDIYRQTNSGIYFDESPKNIKIYLRDSYDNISTFECVVNTRQIVNTEKPKFQYFNVFDNFLHLKSDRSNPLTLYNSYQGEMLIPYLNDKRDDYYLWDLRDGMPDSIFQNGQMRQTDFYVKVPSGIKFNFYNHDIDLEFTKYDLFDTLYLRFSKGFDSLRGLEIFNFPHGDIPLRGKVKVTLKPSFYYGDKSAVYSVYRKGYNYMGGEWIDDGIQFTTKDLVKFTVLEDTVPPTVAHIRFENAAIAFNIKDDLSGVKSYRATLDGQWLMMYYETKKDLIYSVPRDPSDPLKGEFVLEVTDNVGNITNYKRLIQ